MNRLWYAALLAVTIAMAPVRAEGPKPLFAGDDIVRLTITAPVASLAQGPANAKKTVAGTLAVSGEEALPVVLSARGITRRRRETCSFPPLRVEFPDKPGATSLFKGQDKLKLVTHCRPASGFQQYLLLEYAAYRLYNALTPQSFRVRLAQIDYIDGSKPPVSRLGFFIEGTSDMAHRNGLHEFKTEARVPSTQLDPAAAARFALFEDMIGNLDWAMNAGPPGTDCCHNSRLIGAKEAATGLIPVPYDFDFAGLVDAPYAVPPASMKLANVRVRRYRGYCRQNAEAVAGAAALHGRGPELLAVLAAVPQLDERTRAKAAAYLSGFFERIATPESVAAKLLPTCNG